MMTKQDLCAARVVGATLAILGVACGPRDGPGSDDPQPSAGEIAKAVDAWQQSPIKTCSLDAIFPWVSAPQPSPREGWDLGQVMKKLDPNRVWTAGDTHILFGVFPGLEEGQGRILRYEQVYELMSDGAPLAAQLAYIQGRCTVTVGGRVVFDDVLRRATVLGAVGVFPMGQAVQLAVVASGEVPSSMGRIAEGATLIDFSAIGRALGDALFPPVAQDAPNLALLTSELFQLSSARARELFEAGESPVYRDVLLPQGIALPEISMLRDGRAGTLTYRSQALLTNAELAALRQAAELRLVWAYAGSNAALNADRTTNFEIVLLRTGDLSFELSSVRLLGTEPKSDARAATCLGGRLARLRTYASHVPASYYGVEGEPCSQLTQDLVRAAAADPTTIAEAMAWLSDAQRAKAPIVEGQHLFPSDGGNAYRLEGWRELFLPLLVELETRGLRASLTAEPSRVADGFLASLEALDSHQTLRDARPVFAAAAARRALNAAWTRYDPREDWSPLTTAHAARIASALRTDLVLTLAEDVAYLIEGKSSQEVEQSAALTCLSSAALDAQRATIGRLYGLYKADTPNRTWIFEVLWDLLGWSDDTSSAKSTTFCNPAFLTWAEDHLSDKNPPCTYENQVFSSGDYCAK